MGIENNNSASHRCKRSVIERNREEGHDRLYNDYFSNNPVYTEEQFRQRFRMRRHVFLRIVEALTNHDEYFQMRVDVIGRMGLSPLQKCTAAIRILAYGSSADSVDDYVRIGESIAVKCLNKFVRGINEVFGSEYLRRPNNNDIERMLQIGEARGFPGSNNDINVLNQSDVFNDVLEGEAPTVQYMVNRTQYDKGYYLAYGIYPEWATIVKSIPMPQGDKRKLFAQHQEAARKDVERAFGVLQSRFAIVRGPARAWNIDTIKHILYACIILHNMIVEDERHTYDGHFDYSYDHPNDDVSTTDVRNGPHPNLTTYFQRRAAVRDRQIHHQIQEDIVEHIWERFGHDNNKN